MNHERITPWQLRLQFYAVLNILMNYCLGADGLDGGFCQGIVYKREVNVDI